MRARDLATFIKAREFARLVNEQRQMVSGTALVRAQAKVDPIIAKFRFCNMVRADDRVTRFIFQWAERWNGNPDQWFAFVVARLFNLPASLDMITTAVLPFKPEKMRVALKAMRADGQNTFNAAYIVSTNGLAMDKVDYVVDRVLAPLWEYRKRYRPVEGRTLSDYHAKLCEAQGLGSFMAAQVIADVKYFAPMLDTNLGIPTTFAPDWWTFAASGPGSQKGLNAIMDRPPQTRWREAEWRATLGLLIEKVRPMLPTSLGTRMSAQDYQNSLCEYFKYYKVITGIGTPKQYYRPHDGKDKVSS